MDCLKILFIAILAVGKAGILQCSDQQSTGSASGMADLQQVTTLQYCLIDNCTIMRIDTGEKFDVTYTTDNLLVVTPTDASTSMVIAKLDSGPPCNNEYDNLPHSVALLMLIVSVCGYIVGVHLLFKELRNLFGKLLMLYATFMILFCLNTIISLLLHYRVAVNSLATCLTLTAFALTTIVPVDGFATCILAYFAYVMYRSYKLYRGMSSELSTYLLKCYLAYTFGTMTLVLITVAVFYMITGNYRYTLLPDGHCSLNRTSYIFDIHSTITRLAQIVLFGAYLFYYCKVNQHFRDAGVSHNEQNKKLSLIAIAMGATIDVSRFVWLAGIGDTAFARNLRTTSAALTFIQLCVIMLTFTCTEKMSRLWKERFSRPN